MDKDYACGDYGEVRDWTQIRLTVRTADLDKACAIMSMISNQLQIEDYPDIDLKTCYGDLIDEKILNADKEHASVSVYLPAEQNLSEPLSFLRMQMTQEKLEGKVESIGVSEEDWANSWKAYYKPVRIGRRIVIVPAWETFEPGPDDLVVRMDPGMAFGTGTHETTRLVISLLEEYCKPGCRMLDVGTGSGILAICASKLGAGECYAYDLDPMAVRVAGENVEASGLDNIVVGQSDLLAGVDRTRGPYDLICANIVADILIRMAKDVPALMHPDTVLLCSGIILSRAQDVVDAMAGNGLVPVRTEEENDWCAIAFQKAKA